MKKFRREYKLKTKELQAKLDKDIPKQKERLNKVSRYNHYMGDDMIIGAIMASPHCNKYNRNFNLVDKHLRKIAIDVESKDILMT